MVPRGMYYTTLPILSRALTHILPCFISSSAEILMHICYMEGRSAFFVSPVQNQREQIKHHMNSSCAPATHTAAVHIPFASSASPVTTTVPLSGFTCSIDSWAHHLHFYSTAIEVRKTLYPMGQAVLLVCLFVFLWHWVVTQQVLGTRMTASTGCSMKSALSGTIHAWCSVPAPTSG